MSIFYKEELKEEEPKVTFIKAFVFMLPLGFLMHLMFLLIFAVKGITPLYLFNILSVVIYIYIMLVGVKKHFYGSVIIIFLEIIVHSILCCIFIGWTGGFYVYPLCMLPLTYFVSINMSNKYIYAHLSAIFILVNYQFWNIYCARVEAPYEAKIKSIDSILYNINTITASFVLLVLLYSLLVEMKYVQDMLKKKNKILDDIANFDMLTELKNRRSMMKTLENEIEAYKETNKGFYIAIGDIDNFKNFNDTYGHDCGDLVLKKIADILNKNSEKFGIEVSRWGGEEFLILLKSEKEEESLNIFENIIEDIRKTSVYYNEETLKVTMTLGISYFGNSNLNIDDVLKQADNNLYEGKNNGKNCIVLN